MKKHLAVALVASLISAGQAMAWGQEGHSIIGELAQRHLPSNTLDAMKKLLGGEVSLASIASWADDYKFTTEGSYTKILHYVDIDVTQASYQATDCQDHGKPGCLVSAIPDQIAVIRDHSKSDAERKTALLLLVHFMGDLEQPLHAANNGDDGGGNALWVHLNAKRPDNKTWFNRAMKFHEMWDSGLINLRVYAWGTYADEIDKAGLPTVEPGPYDMARIAEWASQTHCDGIEAYRLLVPSLPKGPDGQCTTVEGSKVPSANEQTSPLDIDNKYTDAATPIVTKQLATGGARLAAVLEYAFGS